MQFTPGQCRAARALLSWSQGELAATSGVSQAAIANFELSKSTPIRANLAAIRAALEGAGVEFTNGEGEGVRLRRGKK
jgi:transcriptional regulator with XRE-family HTH domain